jgi:DNA polymerase (family X)
MDNLSIARVLHEIADILEIKGENTFRIRSYRMGAESVQALAHDLVGMVGRGEKLTTLQGVGSGIAGKIEELVKSGVCAYHQELLEEVPKTLLELLKLPGLGPRGVSLVWTRLGVRSAEDLEAAISDGRFRTIPGMKEKKEARIIQSLKERKAATVRFLKPEADATVNRFTRYLQEHGAAQVEAVGSYRRRKESVGDLDFIVLGDPAALSAAFAAHPDVREVLVHGQAKTSVRLLSGIQVDLRPFTPESLGAALQYFTGSKDHNVRLRERAVRQGLKLNEYGVFRVETGDKIAGATEEDVYRALGLAYIPPELREDRGEIKAAEHDALPRLIEVKDLRGDLHAHTDESDGRDTLDVMAEAARARGLSYLALTEHSRAIPSPKNGTGMDETRALAHIARIRATQGRWPGFRLLAGIEVDILPDGRLDMADEVLAQLDVVVASLHSRLDMEREAMTERMMRAVENPHFQIWGHPLARRLLKREPVKIDLEAVMAAAAARGIALEVNCQPERLDLPDHLIPKAKELGLRFVISTDSHAARAFETSTYGVDVARRGWLTADDVLNTRSADEFLSGLRRPTRPGASRSG